MATKRATGTTKKATSSKPKLDKDGLLVDKNGITRNAQGGIVMDDRSISKPLPKTTKADIDKIKAANGGKIPDPSKGVLTPAQIKAFNKFHGLPEDFNF